MEMVIQFEICCCKLIGTDEVFIITVMTAASAVSKSKHISSGFNVLWIQKGSQKSSLGEIANDLKLVLFNVLLYSAL